MKKFLVYICEKGSSKAFSSIKDRMNELGDFACIYSSLFVLSVNNEKYDSKSIVEEFQFGLNSDVVVVELSNDTDIATHFKLIPRRETIKEVLLGKY